MRYAGGLKVRAAGFIPAVCCPHRRDKPGGSLHDESWSDLRWLALRRVPKEICKNVLTVGFLVLKPACVGVVFPAARPGCFDKIDEPTQRCIRKIKSFKNVRESLGRVGDEIVKGHGMMGVISAKQVR